MSVVSKRHRVTRRIRVPRIRCFLPVYTEASLSAKTLAALLAILAGSPGLGSAQSHQHSAADNHRERYSIPAVRVDQPPKIDGVLDDAVWKKAPLVEEFTQQEPREGAAASERTEVRVHLRRRRPAHRRPRVRRAAVGDRRHRDAARFRSSARRGQLPDHPRHLQRLAQRLHVRHHAARREARAADLRGRRRQQPRPDSSTPTSTATGTASGMSPPRITDDGWTAEIAIPLDHAPLRRRRRADVGHQLHAEHPPQERAGVLGADPEGVHA